MKRLRQKNIDVNLLLSKRRTVVGSLIRADADTNVDPNAIYMSKQHSRAFVVNHSDMRRLMEDFEYTEPKARAYYEAVAQLPFHQSGNEGYTNKEHAPPLPSGGERIAFRNITWFANAWKGNSWAKNIREPNGGPPCFWTKDRTVSEDAHTTSWNKYEARYPGRGRRIAYDVHTTYASVLAALREFLQQHPNGSHVWVQGRLEDMPPQQVVARLQADILSDVALSSSVSGQLNVPILAYWRSRLADSVDVGYYNVGRPPQRIPVVPWRVSNYGMRSYGKQLKPQIYPSSSWMTDASPPQDLMKRLKESCEKEVYSNYSGFVTFSPISASDKLDYAWSEIGDNLYQMTFNYAKTPGLHGSSTLGKMYFVLRDGVSEVDHVLGGKRGPLSRQEKITLVSAGMPYWVDGSDPKDFTDLEVSRVPPHHSVHGMSGMMNGEPFDNAVLHGPDGTRTSKGIIRDKSGKKYIILEHNAKTLENGVNSFKDGEETLTSIDKKLFKIQDRTFFNGLGSVSTAQHGSFGLGRDEASLVKQAMRRVRSGHDTSGHMIASALCPSSHLLWYLEEVYNNVKTEKSIYNAPFKEPAGGLYHTIEEYQNAITDMRTLENQSLYPHYARIHVAVCRTFVSFIS